MFAKITLPFSIFLALTLTACDKADFVDSDGLEIRWQDFQGEQLVINYWAEWCGPCIEEIPELNSLYHEGKGNGVSVLGVNFDQPDIESLKAQMKALKVEFPVIHSDPKHQLDYLIPQVLPTTYIFGPDGQLAHRLAGPQTKASLQALLKTK
jgi:thiol-disulfide isomerase/thioredoxin